MLFAGRMVPAGPAHMAMADDETDTATQTTALSITESTPVVTDTSGYHITISISNPTYAATSPGLVTVAYNPSYTFVSRTDIQHWATGDVSIPVRHRSRHGHGAVHRGEQEGFREDRRGGRQRCVEGVADVGAETAAAVTYQATQATHSQSTGSSDGSSGSDRTVDPNAKPIRLHSFLTRSSQGLRNAQTPPMAITMVMPLMNTGQQADKNAIDQLVVHDNGDESDTKSTQSGGGGTDGSTDDGSGNNTDDSENTAATQSSVLTPHDNDALAAKLSLIGKHSDLQTIADPTALASDTGQRIDAVMQPAGFDITAYAAINNVRSYEQAGVGTGAWNARSALAAAPASSNSLPIAWQGKGDWTRQALSTARKQGYQYVIAGHDFDSSTTATVHTGTYTIPTSAGDITVLSEQKELGDLAKGKPTSSDADGETSNAGRIARFVAQSAFYQMEQPYAAMNRNLLVCFGTNMSAAFIDTLMTAVEQSSWLQLTDLNDLIDADAYRTGDKALQIVPQDSHLSERNTRSVTSALESLAESRNDINRFATSVLTDHKASASWIRKIKAAQSTLALHALSSAPRNIDSLVDGAKRLGEACSAAYPSRRPTPSPS